MGGFKFSVDINPDVDMAEFGTFVVNNYHGRLEAVVADDGNATVRVVQTLIHTSLAEDNDVAKIEIVREDMSFDEATLVFSGNLSMFNPTVGIPLLTV